MVASFPTTQGHQLMLVTDQAKLIRMGLESMRGIGRGSAGVRLFNVAEGEHVVSAAQIEESSEDDTDGGIVGGGAPAPDAPDATDTPSPDA